MADLLATAELAMTKGFDMSLRGLMEEKTTIVTMKDESGRFIYVSENLANILGVSYQSLKGKTVDQILPDNFAGRLSDQDVTVMRSMRPSEIINRLTINDTEQVWAIKKVAFICGRNKFVISLWSTLSERRGIA